ncbi:MAG TPA: glycosyltransferase family 39 protein [Streptosporangiaceae bacterium]|nr:glycosyltransferase family 39 protein [Streptosporangiaceae bacterium]
MSFSSSPEIQAPPRDTGWPALAGPSWRLSAPRAVRMAAALAGLVAVCAYLVIAVSRLSYPFTVEWLESNSLVEVHRILAGQPLYAAPTAGYVPDGYPPLYFAVSAAAASVLGVSYLPLRLVSLVSSLVCFALLGRLVQRETGSVAAGVGAAGLFAATYFATDTWFDVGRVDSLFLALSIGGLYAARWMRGTRGAIAAGVLLAAAVLTKQTGLAEGVAVIGALLPGPRRGLACVAALAEVTVLGISTLLLGLTSGGWYVFYVFQLLSEHPLSYSSLGWFLTALLGALGMAACAALIGARRVPPVLLAGCAALAVEGCAALVHSGGTSNDLLPAYLAVALLAGLALGGKSSRWASTASAVLVLAQTALLLSAFHPSQAIPTSADRAVGERLTAGLRAFGGTVAIPADPGLSVLAGMPPAAHQDAAHDVLRASDKAAIASFMASAANAVAARRFSAIITDSAGPPPGYPPSVSRYYRLCPQQLLAGVPAAVFRPVAGISARPAWLWLPHGRGSCQSAVSVLDGAGKESH